MIEKILSSILLLIIIVGVVIGCSKRPPYQDLTHSSDLPSGLKDCKVFEVKVKGKPLTVFRCPMSTTTTTPDDDKSEATVTEDFNKSMVYGL